MSGHDSGDDPRKPRRRWRDRATRWTHGLERRLDRARRRLKGTSAGRPLLVEPYLGYGNEAHVRVRARVLAGRGLGPSGPEDGLLTNLRNAWRRFDSEELAGARVRVTVRNPAKGGARSDDGPLLETTAVSDEEGFLDLDLPLPEPPAPGLLRVEFALAGPLPPGQQTTTFTGEALIPAPDAPYGVISDVDDTVLVTGATRLRAVITRTLLQNARDRLPFPGVAALYRAFEDAGAPLFYVSSSPWNLYGVLSEFLDLNDLPMGPLLLRDWGVTADEILPLRHAEHKRSEIAQVLRAYPELPFVLVGDSGQEDPEIYAEVVRADPGRIRGVLIRHVGDEVRADAVRELARTLAEHGVPLHLVADSAEAAAHAEAHGWIDARERAEVERSTADVLAGRSTEAGEKRV